MTDAYYVEFAAQQRARNLAEHERDMHARAEREACHEWRRDYTDPSVKGPSGPVGYAWMELRGD